MNYLWGFMIIISLVYSGINGNLSETVAAGFEGASSAIEVVLSFAGVMCLWTGLLNAADKAGISALIKKALKPVIKFLFPKLDENGKAYNFITLNICANILGMGNGATPMGIKAMKELDCGSDIPTDDMCMFVVLNTAAFQLLPTSIIALRTSMGAQEPFSVIIPIWITSLISLTFAITSVKIMCKFSKRKGLEIK